MSLRHVTRTLEDDEEDPEEDELHRGYEDQSCDEEEERLMLRWSESQQDWRAKSLEIPSPGRSDLEERVCQQGWKAKSVDIPSPGPVKDFGEKDKVTVRASYSDLVEVVLDLLDSGADCHVSPLSYHSEDLGTAEFQL